MQRSECCCAGGRHVLGPHHGNAHSCRPNSSLTTMQQGEQAAVTDQMCLVIILVISMFCLGFLISIIRGDSIQCCLRTRTDSVILQQPSNSNSKHESHK